MVIITWWDAKAMVPSQPTMIIDSENDAVSMPISKAMGVPSETSAAPTASTNLNQRNLHDMAPSSFSKGKRKGTVPP